LAGIALLGTVTATLASWLVETVAAEKEQAEDLQIVVRRLEDKIDRLAAESQRGLARVDRARIPLDTGLPGSAEAIAATRREVAELRASEIARRRTGEERAFFPLREMATAADPKRDAQLEIKVAGMVTAIVFVKAEVARIPEVAEEIAALNGVSEVYSVTGAIDLIVMIRVANHDQVAEVVADRLNKVPGIVSTETHIAFRAYSSHDLEAAFSLGG